VELSKRVGQVWVLNDGETVELIVSGRAPQGRVNEVRWTTLVLWAKDDALRSRQAGELDQAGEGAFVNAESGDDVRYDGWERLV
jgi:hypothetical protein